MTSSCPAALTEQRTKRTLGDLLVEKGLITSDQLQIAVAEQARRQAAIGRVLVELGMTTEAVIRDALCEFLEFEDLHP